MKNNIQFRINSYLQLARLCDDTQIEEKNEYLDKARELLSEYEALIAKTEISDNETISEFLNLEVEKVQGERTLRAEVTEAYNLFCISRKLKPISRNALYNIMREQGFLETKYNGHYYFKNTKLKSEPDSDCKPE